MARTEFYRYIIDSDKKPGYEVANTRKKREIITTSPVAQGTWYSTDRFDDSSVAEQKLALSAKPTHRIGPILPEQMPDFIIPLRPVAPSSGKSGGGVEALVKEPIYIFGLWEFSTQNWEIPKE